MNKNLLLTLSLLISTIAYTQVGIYNTDPKATLHVVGKPDVTTEPDGVIAPKISRVDLIAKTGYSTAQTGAIIYVTDLSGTTNTSTNRVNEVGYYYFDGSIWKALGKNSSKIGDIKTGIQTTDHDGWIKLDGSSKSALSTAQQANATSLGIGVNLPNATNAYLSQNGTVLGSVSGTNTKNIAQNQLPDVNITTNTAGSHAHTSNATGTAGSYGLIRRSTSGQNVTASTFDTGGSGNEPDLQSTVSALTINATGDHTHIIALNGGATQQAFDVRPQTLSVNTFIYLGED